MVAFYGGSFTAIPVEVQNSLMDAVKPYMQRGKVTGIKLSTRPDCIDRHILDNLKSHGVKEIELGVQSMDDEVLSLAERGHTSDDVRKAASLIKPYGFKLGLQMMVGLPGDTKAKDMYTAVELIRMKPDYVRIYPTLVIRGTSLEEMYKKGLYVALNLKEAVDICSDLLLMFSLYDVPIVRVGLQPTEEINEKGDVVAGPFHPAFRQVVEAKIAWDMMSYAYRCLGGNHLTLVVNPRDLSNVVGVKKSNVLKFCSEYGVTVEVKGEQQVERDTIIFITEKGKYKLSKKEYAKSRNLQVHVEYK
nr:radical SAM protein [Caldanaerobius polysaccharolyticus]